MIDSHDVVETTDVLIPVRDGTRLAANLLRPVAAGRVPAIVVYFPYLKDLHGGSPIADWQRHFAQRGYACLTVDMRGTGGSEGEPAPPFSPSERQDAFDLLAWNAAQPWCDGTTGMWGISYSGSSALAAASMRPPSLRAIVPMHGTANEYFGFLRPHGCRPGWWTEASWGPMMTLLGLLPPLHRDPDGRWGRVWRDRLDRLTPPPFAWHTVAEATYLGWRTDAATVRAATYAVSAWHDYYPQATLDYFSAIPAPKRVLIGPWKHELPDLAVTGAIDHLSEMDRWWDRWLKGVDNGIDREPPVMVWHQGEDVWRYEDDWPPRRGQERMLYAAEGGRLSPAAPTSPGHDRYLVDPTVGLQLLPWDPQAPVVPMPYDRSADDHRSLTYTTDPLDDPVELAGAPEAIVALAADEPEFPLSVCLCDVAPSVRSTLICQGWVSAERAATAPLGAGSVCEIAVPLYSTSYRVPAGHRLRLAIAGADFPLLWPAPRNPTLAVHRSPVHATRLRLPVAPSPVSPLPGPRFGPPSIRPAQPPPIDRWDNRTVRDLRGETAAFQQTAESSRRLADGSVLHLHESTVSTVVAARPGDTTLAAHLMARIERVAHPIVVAVDTVQTADHYHLEGRIEIAGKPYFARSWDLDPTSR